MNGTLFTNTSSFVKSRDIQLQALRFIELVRLSSSIGECRSY